MLGAWPLLSVANGDGCFPHMPTAHAHRLPRTCLLLLPTQAHRTCPLFSLEHAYGCFPHTPTAHAHCSPSNMPTVASHTRPPHMPTVLPQTCLRLLPHMPTGQAHRLPRTCLLLLPTQAHRTCPLFSLEHAYCCCPHISNLVPRTYRLLSRHHAHLFFAHAHRCSVCSRVSFASGFQSFPLRFPFLSFSIFRTRRYFPRALVSILCAWPDIGLRIGTSSAPSTLIRRTFPMSFSRALRCSRLFSLDRIGFLSQHMAHE